MILAHSALGLALGSEVRMAQGLAGDKRTLDFADSHLLFLPIHMFLLLSSPFSPASSARGQAVLGSSRPYCSLWVG